MAYVRLLLENILERLPRLDTKSELPDADVFILANGFEPRCMTVAGMLKDSNRRVPLTLTLHFQTNVEENAAVWDDLDETVQAISVERKAVQMSASPSDFTRDLISALPPRSSDAPIRVLLDISGASGKMILLTLRALFASVRSNGAQISLVIVYTEADIYAPSQEEASSIIADLKKALASRAEPQKELTLGLDRDPQEFCVAYEGHHVEDGPDRAIVICGFNAHRVRAALDNIDPSFNTNLPHPQVTYVVGEPPRPELAWRIDAMKELNAFGTDATAMPFRTSSTLDYQETLRLLEHLYEQSFGVERMTVLAFGSKMQTVAAAVFCEIHPDVRAQTVTPTSYLGAGYSKGSGPVHQLDFGELVSLVDVLDGIGSIVSR